MTVYMKTLFTVSFILRNVLMPNYILKNTITEIMLELFIQRE